VAEARSGERVARVNGVDLCLETFGDVADPAVLLMAGATSSMDWWERDLCVRIASGGRLVIRYDQRDTGRSVTYEPGAPEYTGADLVDDAIGILDSLDVGAAHVVGVSMGGGMAQWLAIAYPERVASLTLVSTSPGSGNDLPPMSDELRSVFANPPSDPDWSDRETVVEHIVDDWAPYVGSVSPGEARLREIAGRVFDRSRNLESSMKNHWLIESGGSPGRARLREITAPTLVVHGTEDPLFPYPHAEALAREIPMARLLPLEGMGHGYPPQETWDVFVPALVEHTAWA
jgi:pimeloyl-ACP methyl ester carboxylesterase